MNDLLENVKNMVKECFDSFKDRVFDFLDYLNIFKEFYEIVFKKECDNNFISIFENIKKQTEKVLKEYLPNYFRMFAFLLAILFIIHSLSLLYLHTYFISLTYVVIVLFIMLIYSYSIYKEFNIEGLDRIIFKFFIFLTLGLWTYILFAVTHMTIVLSFGSIFLNIMYNTVKYLIFYYIFLLFIFPVKCMIKWFIEFLRGDI
ncbi:MAG: hypothetical protein ACO2ON_03940 [Candidatus Nanopusillus sp.]